MSANSCPTRLAIAAWLVALPVLLSAQQTARDAHELLNATLWVQTSAEHHALCETIFKAAAASLDAALRDPALTAAVEQTGAYGTLPPAVVVDIDETILDNSAFAGRLVVDRGPFDNKVWSDWVARAAAPALPGAVAFLRHAADKGVIVFYVTNRGADQEAATRANLAGLGLDLPQNVDTVLMSRERPDWSSDKASRRAAVAQTHRILLLLGDDLGDFVAGARSDPDTRAAIARQYADYWGSRWFILPNPMNGSWETALYGHQFPPDAEVLRQKLARVRSFR
jgi:5'-nucleotidase (lipoprotein e(P4) family)